MRIPPFLLSVAVSILSASAAVSLNLSPLTISSDANTALIHTISGLAAGEKVLVERFADFNGNGQIDAGEFSLRSFYVTDGARPIIGGVVNGNVPGDDDASVPGAIRIDLAFPGPDVVLNRQPGKYVVRVTGPSGTAQRALEITAPSFPQHISGVVRNSVNNNPIPNALLIVLVNDGAPIGSLRADASGAFNFYGPPGNYALIPFNADYVGAFTALALAAGQTVTRDLLMEPATIRIQGRITDDAGTPYPTLFVLGQNETGAIPRFAGVLTDLAGNFAFNVLPGNWGFNLLEEMTAEFGLIAAETNMAVTSGPITITLPTAKATALIYGRVTETNTPVANFVVSAQGNVPALSNGNEVEGRGRTTAAGDYWIGVLGGFWNVSTDNNANSGIRVQNRGVNISAGQAIRSDFALLRATAHLRGRVVDSSGNGVSGVFFHGHFENSNNTSSGVATAEDGSFDLPVWGGQWYFHMDDDASERGYVNHQLSLTIVDGVDQTVTFVSANATAHISGAVKTSSNQGLPNVGIHANATVNGITYEADAQSDSTGAYSIPVINGTWVISLNCDDLTRINSGYNCPNGVSLTINNNNPTQNFIISSFNSTASLNGRVTDSTGAGLVGIRVEASPQEGGSFRGVNTDVNGAFSIPVNGGSWSLYVANVSGTYIAPNLQFFVTDGENINNIVVRLLDANATITGTIKNTAGVAIPGVNVFASTEVTNVFYSVNFATSSQSGAFSFSASRGTWFINVDCSQLETAGYECPIIDSVDTSSGTAVVNIVVRKPVAQPNLISPRLITTGATPVFQFTITGDPAAYDIQGSPNVPFIDGFWLNLDTRTISAGQTSVVVQINPAGNRFFRVQAR